MATLNEDIVSAVSDIQQKLMEMNEERIKMERGNAGARGTTAWRKNLYDSKKLFSCMLTLYNTQYKIVNSDGDQVYNILYEETDAQVRKFIDQVRYRFRIGISGAGMLSVVNYRIIPSSSVIIQGGSLPSGGYAGWTIIQNSSGDAVWEPFPNVLQAPTTLT